MSRHIERDARSEIIGKSHNLSCLIGNLHNLFKNKTKSFGFMIVPISGYAGLGKTTITHKLASMFDGAGILEADSFMMGRTKRHEKNINGADPQAIDFNMLRWTIQQLESGNQVDVPIYNHETGEHDETNIICPSPILFLEGSTVLYQQLELPAETTSIFFDADVKTWSKLFYDVCVRERGYSDEEFRNKLLPNQMLSNKNFVEPSKENATYICHVDSNRHYKSPTITNCLC